MKIVLATTFYCGLMLFVSCFYTPTSMKIVLATTFYCGLMLFVSCFYTPTFFDPVGFLWLFCFFLGGPILALISLVLLVLDAKRRMLRPSKALSRIFCIVIVAVWTLGFWRISHTFTPRVFASVAKANERLAVSFMQQHPPDTEFETRGFRYPYCPLFPYGSLRVSHHAGVVSIRMPSPPDTMDFLVYVSPGSSLNYPPPTEENMGQGYEVKNIVTDWYYVHAVGI